LHMHDEDFYWRIQCLKMRVILELEKINPMSRMLLLESISAGLIGNCTCSARE
jgi:hypothetical protein